MKENGNGKKQTPTKNQSNDNWSVASVENLSVKTINNAVSQPNKGKKSPVKEKAPTPSHTEPKIIVDVFYKIDSLQTAISGNLEKFTKNNAQFDPIINAILKTFITQNNNQKLLSKYQPIPKSMVKHRLKTITDIHSSLIMQLTNLNTQLNNANNTNNESADSTQTKEMIRKGLIDRSNLIIHNITQIFDSLDISGKINTIDAQDLYDFIKDSSELKSTLDVWLRGQKQKTKNSNLQKTQYKLPESTTGWFKIPDIIPKGYNVNGEFLGKVNAQSAKNAGNTTQSFIVEINGIQNILTQNEVEKIEPATYDYMLKHFKDQIIEVGIKSELENLPKYPERMRKVIEDEAKIKGDIAILVRLANQIETKQKTDEEYKRANDNISPPSDPKDPDDMKYEYSNLIISQDIPDNSDENANANKIEEIKKSKTNLREEMLNFSGTTIKSVTTTKLKRNNRSNVKYNLFQSKGKTNDDKTNFLPIQYDIYINNTEFKPYFDKLLTEVSTQPDYGQNDPKFRFTAEVKNLDNITNLASGNSDNSDNSDPLKKIQNLISSILHYVFVITEINPTMHTLKQNTAFLKKIHNELLGLITALRTYSYPDDPNGLQISDTPYDTKFIEPLYELLARDAEQYGNSYINYTQKVLTETKQTITAIEKSFNDHKSTFKNPLLETFIKTDIVNYRNKEKTQLYSTGSDDDRSDNTDFLIEEIGKLGKHVYELDNNADNNWEKVITYKQLEEITDYTNFKKYEKKVDGNEWNYSNWENQINKYTESTKFDTVSIEDLEKYKRYIRKRIDQYVIYIKRFESERPLYRAIDDYITKTNKLFNDSKTLLDKIYTEQLDTYKGWVHELIHKIVKCEAFEKKMHENIQLLREYLKQLCQTIPAEIESITQLEKGIIEKITTLYNSPAPGTQIEDVNPNVNSISPAKTQAKDQSSIPPNVVENIRTYLKIDAQPDYKTLSDYKTLCNNIDTFNDTQLQNLEKSLKLIHEKYSKHKAKLDNYAKILDECIQNNNSVNVSIQTLPKTLESLEGSYEHYKILQSTQWVHVDAIESMKTRVNTLLKRDGFREKIVGSFDNTNNWFKNLTREGQDAFIVALTGISTNIEETKSKTAEITSRINQAYAEYHKMINASIDTANKIMGVVDYINTLHANIGEINKLTTTIIESIEPIQSVDFGNVMGILSETGVNSVNKYNKLHDIYNDDDIHTYKDQHTNFITLVKLVNDTYNTFIQQVNVWAKSNQTRFGDVRKKFESFNTRYNKYVELLEKANIFLGENGCDQIEKIFFTNSEQDDAEYINNLNGLLRKHDELNKKLNTPLTSDSVDSIKTYATDTTAFINTLNELNTHQTAMGNYQNAVDEAHKAIPTKLTLCANLKFTENKNKSNTIINKNNKNLANLNLKLGWLKSNNKTPDNGNLKWDSLQDHIDKINKLIKDGKGLPDEKFSQDIQVEPNTAVNIDTLQKQLTDNIEKYGTDVNEYNTAVQTLIANINGIIVPKIEEQTGKSDSSNKSNVITDLINQYNKLFKEIFAPVSNDEIERTNDVSLQKQLSELDKIQAEIDETEKKKTQIENLIKNITQATEKLENLSNSLAAKVKEFTDEDKDEEDKDGIPKKDSRESTMAKLTETNENNKAYIEASMKDMNQNQAIITNAVEKIRELQDVITDGNKIDDLATKSNEYINAINDHIVQLREVLEKNKQKMQEQFITFELAPFLRIQRQFYDNFHLYYHVKNTPIHLELGPLIENAMKTLTRLSITYPPKKNNPISLESTSIQKIHDILWKHTHITIRPPEPQAVIEAEEEEEKVDVVGLDIRGLQDRYAKLWRTIELVLPSTPKPPVRLDLQLLLKQAMNALRIDLRVPLVKKKVDVVGLDIRGLQDRYAKLWRNMELVLPSTPKPPVRLDLQLLLKQAMNALRIDLRVPATRLNPPRLDAGELLGSIRQLHQNISLYTFLTEVIQFSVSVETEYDEATKRRNIKIEPKPDYVDPALGAPQQKISYNNYPDRMIEDLPTLYDKIMSLLNKHTHEFFDSAKCELKDGYNTISVTYEHIRRDRVGSIDIVLFKDPAVPPLAPI